MVFCGNCGKEVKTPMKFCPYCGTPLVLEAIGTPPSVPVSTEAPQPTTTPPPPPSPEAPPAPPPVTLKDKSHLFSTAPTTGSELFASYRKGYIVNEDSWDWGSGEILDENGRKIGSMTRKLLSLRSEIQLKELDGTLAAKITKKMVAVKPTYDIKDPSDNLVGRIDKALLSLRPKLTVKDGSGNKALEIKGNFRAWDFKISDAQGNHVGTVSKLDRWQDVFWGGIMDKSDKYALKIDGDADRLLLVASVIAIDNMFHDE